MNAACFRCEKEIDEAAVGIGVWVAPGGGVHFAGGWTFGSALYDAMLTGKHVEVIVCDDCLLAARGTNRLREVMKGE